MDKILERIREIGNLQTLLTQELSLINDVLNKLDVSDVFVFVSVNEGIFNLVVHPMPRQMYKALIYSWIEKDHEIEFEQVYPYLVRLFTDFVKTLHDGKMPNTFKMHAIIETGFLLKNFNVKYFIRQAGMYQ